MIKSESELKRGFKSELGLKPELRPESDLKKGLGHETMTLT